MRKPLLTFILTGLLLAALPSGLPARAAETTAAPESAEAESAPEPREFPEAGITLAPPASWMDTDGLLSLNGGRELQPGSGIVYLEVDYLPLTREEYSEAQERAQSGDQSAYEEIAGAALPLFYVFGINGGRSAEDLTDIVFAGSPEEERDALQIRETGSAGDFVFCTAAYDADYITEIFADTLGIYASPYAALLEEREVFESGLTYSEPELEAYTPAAGNTIQFEGTDLLTGEPVTSEELFADHKVTMINLWATWCIWCVKEMPDLEALSKSFEEKDGQIIGIVLDTLTDEAAAREAVSIMKEAGVTFRMIVPPENIADLLPVSAYPTTYFVDSSGTILDEPVVGANVRAYSLTMESLLNR